MVAHHRPPAISFAIGVSIPLMIVAIAGFGRGRPLPEDPPAPFAHRREASPLIALALGITTDAPDGLRRMIPIHGALEAHRAPARTARAGREANVEATPTSRSARVMV